MKECFVPGTVAVAQFTPVVDALSVLGVDPSRVLSRAGLRWSDVRARDPFARIPSDAEFRIWDALQEVTGDPLIGLRVGQCVQAGALGAYEYLVRNCTSLREAVTQANRFELLLDDLTRIELVEEGERAALRLSRRGGYPHPARGTECFFYVFVKIAHAQAFAYFEQSEVQFVHEAPCEPSRFAEHFPCKVTFRAAHTQMLFPVEVVDQPLPLSDPKLAELFEQHLESQLRSYKPADPLLYQAREAIADTLGAGLRSCDHVAAQLGVSGRSLRRRLRQRGTSYSALLDEVRRERARQEVADGERPIAEVANDLGFTEPSTFYRAFRRWYGTTPAAYRRAEKE